VDLVERKEEERMNRLLLPEGQTKVGVTDDEREEAVKAALYVTLSPHEWEWTPYQQEMMARYCLWASQRLWMIERIAAGVEMYHAKEGESGE
jgi:hypothetical protein